MLTDGVNNNGILLSLFFEEVLSSDFWKSQNLCEISMLIPSELCDMSLSDFLQRQLLLDLLHMLCSCPNFLLFLPLASSRFFFQTHSFDHIWFILINPFAIKIVLQFSHFQFLEASDFSIFSYLLCSLHLKNFLIQSKSLLQHLNLGHITVFEIGSIEVDSWSERHRVNNDLEDSDRLKRITSMLIN